MSRDSHSNGAKRRKLALQDAGFNGVLGKCYRNVICHSVVRGGVEGRVEGEWKEVLSAKHNMRMCACASKDRSPLSNEIRGEGEY